MKRNRILKNALKVTTLVIATAMTFGYSFRNVQNNTVKARWPFSEEAMKEREEQEDFVKMQLKLETLLKENGFESPRIKQISLKGKGGIFVEFIENRKLYKATFLINPNQELNTPTTYKEAIDFIDNLDYLYLTTNSCDENAIALAERYFKLNKRHNLRYENCEVVTAFVNPSPTFVASNPGAGQENLIYKAVFTFRYLIVDQEGNYKNAYFHTSNFYEHLEQFKDVKNLTLEKFLDVYEQDRSYIVVEDFKEYEVNSLTQNYLTRIDDYYNGEYDYIIELLQKDENEENKTDDNLQIENPQLPENNNQSQGKDPIPETETPENNKPLEEDLSFENEILEETEIPENNQPQIEEIFPEAPQEETNTISPEDFFKNVNVSILNGQSVSSSFKVDYAPSLEKAYKKQIEENIKNYDLVR